MGTLVSKIFTKLTSLKKELRILMLGLDAAGKTSILYKFKLGQTVHTIPTVGFNMETLSYKNVKLNTWDVGGQDKIRPLWSFYYSGAQGLIFVVDSVDKERLEEAKQELHRILNHADMRQAVILVYANKQDVPGALSPAEVQDRLDLVELKDRFWFVQPCCAVTGDGLYEGLAWLTSNLDV